MGLILNVMPCVLPVISLKLFSFIKQSNEAPERVLRLGLAYAAGGVRVVPGVCPRWVVVFKQAGQHVGYAFQLQNPWFVVGLCVVTFVFALSLLGVFEVMLPGSVTNAAGTCGGQPGRRRGRVPARGAGDSARQRMPRAVPGSVARGLRSRRTAG